MPRTHLINTLVGSRESLSYQNGQLHFMGHDLNQVMAHLSSTPVYIYSFKRITQNLERLRQAFSGPIAIHYAFKANSNTELLRKLSALGVGADVVSGGEIKRALECGFDPSKIIFSGVGKTVQEIRMGLEKNVGIFNVESPQELERIGKLALELNKKASVSFRMNPDVNPKTHPYITTGFKENKFGMDKKFLPELLKILKAFPKSLELMGLDFHIGSQLFDLKALEDALEKTISLFLKLRKEGFSLKTFDIGGGLGIPYEGEKPFNLKKYGAMVEKNLGPLGCHIICEPGRFLVGDAGILVTQVEYTKKTKGKTFVIVNTGMHHLLRPALYQAYHEIVPLKKLAKSRLQKVDVVGPICESSDWLAKGRSLPAVKQGDLLAICDVGAYGFAMASDYNLHEKPLEVFVD